MKSFENVWRKVSLRFRSFGVQQTWGAHASLFSARLQKFAEKPSCACVGDWRGRCLPRHWLRSDWLPPAPQWMRHPARLPSCAAPFRNPVFSAGLPARATDAASRKHAPERRSSTWQRRLRRRRRHNIFTENKLSEYLCMLIGANSRVFCEICGTLYVRRIKRAYAQRKFVCFLRRCFGDVKMLSPGWL